MSENDNLQNTDSDSSAEYPSTHAKKIVRNRANRRRSKLFVPKGKITLKQLQKYKTYLEAIGNARTGRDQAELLSRMKKSDFNVVCTCMNDFLYDRGVMHNYFSGSESNRLKGLIKPYSKYLKKFTNPKTSYKSKKLLLYKKQKGGSAILAAVIGSLLPMAVNAIGRWISGSKKK